MSLDTRGTLELTGEPGPEIPVRVQNDDAWLKLTTPEETVGHWPLADIGIRDRSKGFSIRAEGEEILLTVEDEVGFAEHVGLAAATPRLARKLAAASNPEERELEVPETDDTQSRTNVMALAFALGGVMVLLGGTFLRPGTTSQVSRSAASEPTWFWSAFVFGGLVMVAVAYLMTMRKRWVSLVALLAVAALVGMFGYMVSEGGLDGSQIAAYGFIAGGIVVGVSVLFSGSLRTTD